MHGFSHSIFDWHVSVAVDISMIIQIILCIFSNILLLIFIYIIILNAGMLFILVWSFDQQSLEYADCILCRGVRYSQINVSPGYHTKLLLLVMLRFPRSTESRVPLYVVVPVSVFQWVK